MEEIDEEKLLREYEELFVRWEPDESKSLFG